MKAENFLKTIPSFILEIITFFNKRNLDFTLVGGTPRDFLLNGVLGHDWDVEISSLTHGFSVSFWKEISKELRSFGEVSNLSYQVIRLKVGDYEFEFSPPRREVFEDSDHHKNFEAEFDFKLPPTECWIRRDFTVNAIGFKLTSTGLEVIDPFDGLTQLAQKMLHPCSADFTRDPVRYLRAYRFAEKLGFSFSETLKTYLSVMPKNFSAHYLFSEMKKSKSPLEFYQSLIKAGCQTLPILDEEVLSESFKKAVVEETNLYCWMMSLEFVGLAAEKFCEYFSLSKILCKKIISFADLSRRLSLIDVEILKNDFDIVKDSEELHLVFSWYFGAQQLISKSETHFADEFIKVKLPDWHHLLSFEPLKDVRHIDPPLRAKYIVWNLCQRI